MKRIIYILSFIMLYSCNTKETKKKVEQPEAEEWINSENINSNLDYYLKFMNLDYKNFLLKSYKLINENELKNEIIKFNKPLVDAIYANKVSLKNKILHKINSPVDSVFLIKYRVYMGDNQVETFREKVLIENITKENVFFMPYLTEAHIQMDSILIRKYKSQLLLNQVKTLLSYKEYIPKNELENSIKNEFNKYSEYVRTNNLKFFDFLLLPQNYEDINPEELLKNNKPDIPFKRFLISNIEKINCTENLFILDYDIDLGNNIYGVASRSLINISKDKVQFLLYDDEIGFNEDYSDIFNNQERKCISKKMTENIY